MYEPPTIDQWRISDGWHDVAGNWNEVSPEVRQRLRDSIDTKLLDEDHHPPPLLWFVRRGEHHDLMGPCDVVCEDGTALSAADTSDGMSLPPDLPLGCHQLIPRDGGPITKLFVVPRRQQLPERCWGWTTQLYAARSTVSWGQGDLGDLAELAEWAASQGAALLAHNPLGDTLPVPDQEPSPYFTSSRRFRSLLYLDIPSVPGATQLGGRLDELVAMGRALNTGASVDRDRVHDAKLTALRTIWGEAGDTDRVRLFMDHLRDDEELFDHATFNALADLHGGGWTSWSRSYSHPRSRAVTDFRRANADEVDFWAWVQALIDMQYEHAGSTGAALVGDLPVGFTVDGSDAWVDQDALGLDWRIGAPGDEFNPDGQNWGIVPYLPQRLRSFAYEPWRRTLRRVLRCTGMVRIDHVMGLFRQFLIPDDTSDSNGAYLYQYGTELLDVTLMEAVVAGVTVIGEDLGTVEAGVREELGARCIAGYRIAVFEDDPPAAWPDASIAALGTHDLPTLTGLLTGADAVARADAGLTVDPADDERMLDRVRRNFLGDTASDVDLDEEVHLDEQLVKAHEVLSSAGSRFVFASLDDACRVPLRPNVPGTVDELPNWRRPLPVPIEYLGDTLAPRIADVMEARSTKVRPGPRTDAEDGLDRSDRLRRGQ